MHPLQRLRELCLALPETTERLSHGEPTWFVRGKKVFVTYADCLRPQLEAGTRRERMAVAYLSAVRPA